MSKSPAFLFYSKDWLTGTAEMLPVEKGVFIDLLCHQHQNGTIPAEPARLARLVGMGQTDFDAVWSTVRLKFADADGNRLHNPKLTNLMLDFKAKQHKNAIIGKFAVLCRGLEISKKQYLEIKSKFKIDEFMPFTTDEATERLSVRFSEWYQSIVNGKEYVNGKGNEDDKGGVGEKEETTGDAKSALTIPDTWDQDRFRQLWTRWAKYKADQFKFRYKSIDSEQAAIKELYKESQGNFDEAVAIINYSISKAYKGFKREWWLNGTATMDQQIKQAQGASQSYKSFSTKVVPV